MTSASALYASGDPISGNIRIHRVAIGSDLIALVLRLYPQADEDVRQRCLNMIDDLTDVPAFRPGGLERRALCSSPP